MCPIKSLKKVDSLSQEIGFYEKLVEFFYVIAQVDGLYREVNRVCWLARASLLRVVDFVVHAEESSTRVEEAVFIVVAPFIIPSVLFVFFVTNECQEGFVCVVVLAVFLVSLFVGALSSVEGGFAQQLELNLSSIEGGLVVKLGLVLLTFVDWFG